MFKEKLVPPGAAVSPGGYRRTQGPDMGLAEGAGKAWSQPRGKEV